MLLALLLCCTSLLSYGQQRTITGTVIDEQGKAVAGATVAVKGTNVATATDDEGNFSINATSNVLEVSAVGFETTQVNIEGTTSVTVVLKAGAIKA